MIHATINPHDVFDRQALVQMLGVRDATIRREKHLGRLPAHPMSGRDYFIGAEVLAWIASKSSQIAPSIGADDTNE